MGTQIPLPRPPPETNQGRNTGIKVSVKHHATYHSLLNHATPHTLHPFLPPAMHTSYDPPPLLPQAGVLSGTTYAGVGVTYSQSPYSAVPAATTSAGMVYAASTAGGAASHVLPSHTPHHYLGSPTLTPAAVPAYNVHVLSGGAGGAANGVTGATPPAAAEAAIGLDGASFVSNGVGVGVGAGGGRGGNNSASVYGGVSADGGAVPRVSPTLSSAAPVFSMATGSDEAAAAAAASAPGMGQVIYGVCSWAWLVYLVRSGASWVVVCPRSRGC